MLRLEGSWRYDSPAAMDSKAVQAFRELIDTACGQAPRKPFLEHFKSHFASAAKQQYYSSSSTDWALTDLIELMDLAAKNAPLFIEAFYAACKDWESTHPDMDMPEVERINRLLINHDVSFQIDPPNLVATREPVAIAVPAAAPSLDAQARDRITQSLDASENLLREGKARPAVQEALWSLETVSTVFKGETVAGDSITGHYFSKIIKELHRSGTGHRKRILTWMTDLYGYLSSPSGGGIRHGVDLREGRDIEINEARLYCNLIRSYLTFLMDEHASLHTDPHDDGS